MEVRAGRRNIFPLVLSFFAAASQSPRPVLPARGKSSTRTSAAFFFIPLSFLSSLDGCVFLGAAVLSPRLWASPTLSRCCCCLVFPPLCPARFISSLAAANGGANKFFCFFFFLLGRMVVSSLTRARSLARSLRMQTRRGEVPGAKNSNKRKRRDVYKNVGGDINKRKGETIKDVRRGPSATTRQRWRAVRCFALCLLSKKKKRGKRGLHRRFC